MRRTITWLGQGHTLNEPAITWLGPGHTLNERTIT